MMRFAEVLQIQLEETDLDHLVACLVRAFLESPPIMIANVKPVVARLSENYPLGIISDSALTPGSFARQLMDQDGILQFLRHSRSLTKLSIQNLKYPNFIQP